MTISKRMLGHPPVFILLAAAVCGCNGEFSSTGPNSVKSHSCDVTYDTGFPTDGSVNVQKPADCPVSIPNPSYVIDWAGVARFRPGTTDRIFQVVFRSAVSNEYVRVFMDYTWTLAQNYNDYDVVVSSGSYRAGADGFQYGSVGDKAYNTIWVQGNQRTATAILTYQFGNALVHGDMMQDVLPNTAFHVDESFHDPQAVDPVSWQWWDNDQLLPYTTPSFTYPGSPEGTDHNFVVTATDGNGNTWTDGFYIHTKTCNYSGCNDQ